MILSSKVVSFCCEGMGWDGAGPIFPAGGAINPAGFAVCLYLDFLGGLAFLLSIAFRYRSSRKATRSASSSVFLPFL